MIIVTLDGGEIETGFWGADVSKIQLGALPLMTTQQFASYATLALTEGVIPQLDAETRVQWAQDVRTLRERIESIPILHITGQFFAQSIDELTSQFDTLDTSDKAELDSALCTAMSPTDNAVYYKENPFKVQPDRQRVGFTYEGEVRHIIDKEDFFNLIYDVVDGGAIGWSKHGTYQEVKDAAAQIGTALNA